MGAISGGRPRDIESRTFAFALRIVRLCQVLEEKGGVARTLGWQLLRSGTSIGANVEEAQAGQSRADFRSKNSVALKEARETRYWLRLLEGTKIVKPERLRRLMAEAEELSKILGAIVLRAAPPTR